MDAVDRDDENNEQNYDTREVGTSHNKLCGHRCAAPLVAGGAGGTVRLALQ